MTLYGAPNPHHSPPPRPSASKHPGTSTATKVTLGLAVLLVVTAVIQGATVQQIGFGPFSVSFAKKDAGPQPTTPPHGSRTVPNPTSGLSTPPQPTNASTTGTWTATRVTVVVTVSQVDVEGGHVRLHTKVTNNADESIELPLFGYFTASDNTGRTYTANQENSDWAMTCPGSGFLTGVIELNSTISPEATMLSISFTEIFGFGAPQGGVTVTGIPVPQAAAQPGLGQPGHPS